nr:hypothetical protein [Nonomuraea deserti]
MLDRAPVARNASRSEVELGEVVGTPAAPFDQEEARVITCRPPPLAHQCVRQAPYDLLHGSGHGPDVLDGADQTFFAELLAAGLVLFDETIGIEQHPIVTYKPACVDPRGGAAEADR